ncbi:MAG: UDP-N-acetylmuramate:L-alanyl-gamma-D-glutamyl-meso-diaminopimelate ligase [Thermodesulfobacteria bacterium]|nr:UDP-N-acetylmuramate:L-alanyl-gamma-D-glutamyl-meso-diaminopimelate ligase [Thermodesulfobacteriota bacterium]
MQSPFKVYLMGIGGVGMGALAGLFREAGLEVSGSESGPVYPPMSNLLEEISARIYIGYDPQNIVREDPDLVIVGNVIRRDNPEILYVLSARKPYLSFPEALYGYFIRGRKSLVVAGTHGKTTTSALLGYALEGLGTDPVFLVGGLLRDRGRNFRYGEGPYIVLEGDEYDTAFFDKRPKFVHYAPYGAILTSVEFDHADIYPDLDTLRGAFSDFLSLIPPEGVLLYFADDPEVSALAANFSGRRLGYGRRGDLRLLRREVSAHPLGQKITYLFRGEEGSFFVPLVGEHNALNALAVFGLLRELGLASEDIKKALATFPGTKRRQEILLEEPFVVVDDFAHHPTAVRVTIEAFREIWPARRLLACFEPRTNTSRRKIFEKDYVESLSLADVALLKTPPQLEKVPPEERIDLGQVAKELRGRGVEALAFSQPEEMLATLKRIVSPGDIVLFMSNGPFDHLPVRLVEEVDKS